MAQQRRCALVKRCAARFGDIPVIEDQSEMRHQPHAARSPGVEPLKEPHFA
jgi:hypothetical protein